MLVLIKGAGDLATGVAHRLRRCGFDIVMTEIEEPTTVRRTVAFSQAVYDKTVEVEGIKAALVTNVEMIKENIANGIISVIVDKEANIIKEIKPDVVVDAIIAKKNTGTSINDAPIVRGMLQERITVFKGMKSGDIDPRCDKEHCFTISDKARCIGGGVLEGILFLKNK